MRARLARWVILALALSSLSACGGEGFLLYSGSVGYARTGHPSTRTQGGEIRGVTAIGFGAVAAEVRGHGGVTNDGGYGGLPGLGARFTMAGLNGIVTPHLSMGTYVLSFGRLYDQGRFGMGSPYAEFGLAFSTVTPDERSNGCTPTGGSGFLIGIDTNVRYDVWFKHRNVLIWTINLSVGWAETSFGGGAPICPQQYSSATE